MDETVRSCERGRVGLWVIGGGVGAVADWPVMRVEEHSFEASVGLAVGGIGGWFGGKDLSCLSSDSAFAWACCSHSDRVFGSTGHALSSGAEVEVGAGGRAAGCGCGGGGF
jgi:hypothetical protein